MTNIYVRLIKQDELYQLLSLYKHLNPDDPDININKVQNHWNDIISDPLMKIIVVELEGKIISSTWRGDIIESQSK